MRLAILTLALAACTDFQFAEELACSDFGSCPPGQFCDPAGDVCRADLPGCGNGELDDGEVCDDGNRTTGDGCRADCAKAEVCGDGVLDPQEACDDGNAIGGDGCAADCAIEGCGNGVVDDGEECDDGDANALTAACLPSCKQASCGDGNLQAGVEACDDGAGNGETAACLPSCVVATCGDGFVQAGVEACDDDNAIETDGCHSDCTLPSCGDGEVQIGVELCEPSQLSFANRCKADCTSEGVIQVAAGLDHTCALRAPGLVRCWGEGSSGQLGHGNTTDLGDDEPPALAGDIALGALATAIASGASHSCALLAGGTVACWGAGADGRLGYGTTANIGDDETPASAGVVDVGGAVVQLAAGSSHTCALLATGAVRCWGNGATGRLGYGNTQSIGDDETPASAGDVTVGGSVTQLVAGDAHTCALLATGAVRCWGTGADGRLGYGNTQTIGDNESPASAGDVPLGAPATFLAAGDQHTCAVLATGAVRCWGAGADGRLGYGNTQSIGDDEPPSSAGDVAAGGPAVEVAAGARHTCALLTTGQVRCWGAGVDGRLGNKAVTTIGDDEDPDSRPAIKLGLSATRISAGPTHTCALLVSGEAMCWGTGTGGRLGYGATANVGDDEDPATAGAVFVIGAVMQVVAGEFHTCALGDAGQVRCWGSNSSGQLGYGNTDTIGDDEQPRTAGDVDVGGKAIQLAAGSAHTCALLEGGTVRCWGENTDGRLGYGNKLTIGDDEAPSVAGDLALGGVAVQISAGSSHTCAVLVGGTLRCWGSGTFGKLGYGTTNTIGDDETPAAAGDVDVGGTVVEVSAGAQHTCARLTTGAVRCWGLGANGRLGYANTTNLGDNELPSTAGEVDVGATVSGVVAGGTHTCALTQSGTVRCWGQAFEGHLGYANNVTIGDDEPPSAAGDVSVGGTVVQLSAGALNTCALLATGKVRCWGSGFNGRNGYGNANNIGDDETPASAGDLDISPVPVTQITTGNLQSCARLANGRLRCWGSGFAGALGYASTENVGDNEVPSIVGDVAVF